MKRIGSKIMFLVSFIIVIFDIIIIASNYSLYKTSIDEYSINLLETTANMCLLIVDGDTIESYTKTRERDNNYYETLNKLTDYAESSKDISRISVISFDDNDKSFTWVYDTSVDSNAHFLGDRTALTDTQIKYLSSFKDGNSNVFIRTSSMDTVYVPVYSSYSLLVGYIRVSLDKSSLNQSSHIQFKAIGVVSTGLCALVIILMIASLNMVITRPLKKMTNALGLIDDYGTAVDNLEIGTGDELESLWNLVKMFKNRVQESASSLAVAEWNASHDAMTSLYNKGFYLKKICSLSSNFGVVYCDIDNLKRVNDELGHELGDDIIKSTAKFISGYAVGGYPCRFGGDEFIVIFDNTSEEFICDLVSKMRSDDDAVLDISGVDFICRVAVGGAFWHENERFADTIKRAEMEMYANKHVIR